MIFDSILVSVSFLSGIGRSVGQKRALIRKKVRILGRPKTSFHTQFLYKDISLHVKRMWALACLGLLWVVEIHSPHFENNSA